MSVPEVEFSWTVDQSGYRWIETAEMNGEPGRFLTSGRPLGTAGYKVRRYAPLLRYTGLFRTFAGSDVHAEAIRRFADRFGALGGKATRLIALPEAGNESRKTLGRGEPLAEWTRAILRMRDAIRVWGWVQGQDVEALRQHVLWKDGRATYESQPDLAPGELPQGPFHLTYTDIASPHHRAEILSQMEEGDVVRAGLFYVQKAINDQMQGNVSPQLLWNPDHGRLEFRLVPGSLLGALWLQFAGAIDRDARYRQCPECGDWFEIALGKARKDKTYCSTNCRTKAFRRRKVEGPESSPGDRDKAGGEG